MATAREPPPPLIVKAGNYTVFITNPNPNATPFPQKEAPLSPNPTPLPPIQAPPLQLDKRTTSWSLAHGLGFFKEAVSKFQNVHLIFDEYLAEWLGLNQSKYQWALSDY